ncbi:MAG: glycosyltransferase [Opitutales bacterium]
MKILFFQDYLRQGGTETQTLFLARGFRDVGAQVKIVTFRPGGALAPQLESSGLEHQTLQPFDTGINGFAPGWQRAVRQFDPDIVVLMGRMANALGWRIKKLSTKASVVATARTGKSFSKAYRKTFAAASAIVANSCWAADRVALAGGEPAHTHVIHNGFARDWNDPEAIHERIATRLDAGVGDGACVFLSVAAFRPGKGQETLIRLFGGLRSERPWQLWMVGDGVRRAACEALVRKLGMQGRVRFWGSQPKPRPYYAGADCAVHASRTESLPNFLVEAQTASLPVIAMRAGGVNETFQPGESGFLHDQGDFAGFVDSLKLLLEDAELRHRMGEAGAVFARSAFNPKASVEAYLELFRKLRLEGR